MVRKRRKPRGSGAFHLPGPPPLLVLPGRQHFAQQQTTANTNPQHDVLPPSDPKKFNQWQRWSNEVIPSLIGPYLKYQRESSSLCHRPGLQSGDVQCRASCHRRTLEVTCVFFDYLEVLNIDCCPCAPAPLQLLRLGLFACAPIAPSLAVDLCVLELVRTLFVRVTPNTTAWCEALEVFLTGRGYKLSTKDNLRRRFSNAYHWYSVLVTNAGDHIYGLISQHLPSRSSADEVLPIQPSDYLRSRCPVCFGMQDWQKDHSSRLKLDCHVCIDACFTQKRSASPRGANGLDPPNPTRSVFISDEEVARMEAHVLACRGSLPGRGTKRKKPEGDEDGYEDGMRIPISTLDACRESFLAADEKREKASTHFFADTGVMALLCRHNCVLWLVNMTSAGEKQYYALALIKKLFEHLPPSMTVGILYDIACQLERSCLKYRLLEDAILSRITFSISVFHAYGHQWPCQLLYHPRKCEGFGLSDGEGCERLWSALKLLIPPLRVSGYHQRLFVLNAQVRHLDGKNLDTFGEWLSRRWTRCQTKKSDAEDALRQLSVDEANIRLEWRAQVEHQTKPLSKRSKTNNDEQISKILALERTLSNLDESLRALETQLCAGNVPNILDFNTRLSDERAHRSRVADTLRRWKAALGIGQLADLQQLRRSIFLQVRLDAHAVKTRIRERLRQRKFEIERFERSYRQTVNEHKLHAHAEASIQRRNPTIRKLVTTYNSLCSKLIDLIRRGEAPAGAIPPHSISPTGIFQLDVDDDIWQDAGLDSYTLAPPGWLADENTRAAIKFQLEVDRCTEEGARIMRECCALQEWMMAEWDALQEARTHADENEDLCFHFDLRARFLSGLVVHWQSQVRPIPCAWPLPDSWGPIENDLAEAANTYYQPSRLDGTAVMDDSENDWESEDERENDELIDQLEEAALAETYRDHELD
ncbi:hypothetical protein DEU56DRAFT_870390 [Suillus clintonianus]|uniref:uncharacterized protein n=1 Tax=Suillus clintonianus TaxID=1904413 RepID=UPI001B87F739|nr:uncharacterized protein DEU56DRAFT_870390 [Suillus clintonianus]KAG2144232.1 hypothetical protein DEU56DRAFT_870390 [Suillus clintonianus]